MATQGVDIRLLGDKALERKLSKLVDTAQKRAVRPAMRKAAKQVKAYLIENLSGKVVKVKTGRLRDAMTRAKILAVKGKRRVIGVAIDLPTRDELGIAPDDKWYYPNALEYGTPTMSAKRPFRRAVDDHEKELIAQMASDIGRNIEREAARQ